MNQFFAMLAGMDPQRVFAAAAVIGGLYYFMAFDSGANLEAEIANIQSQVQSETARKKDTDETLAEEQRMKAFIGTLSEKYQLVSKKLPTDLSTFEINTAVETYARETQIRITGTKPGTPQKMEIVNEVPLDVSLEGKYEDLLQFMFNVTAAERMTKIKSFVITPITSADRITTTGRLRFDGVVVGYKLAPEPESPPTAGRGR